MASIVLSFVGNQDPESLKTRKEGSIVTLMRYLLGQNHEIKKVLLLHTEGTKDNAYLTQDWLKEYLFIPNEKIEIISLTQSFSDDPINFELATKEAYQALKTAQKYQSSNDYFEFNGSSGTPAMKIAWGILQATGYGKNTRLWQIRNPEEMRRDQEFVFENSVNIFKDESDIKTIKKQLQNYNYYGALNTLENSNLSFPDIEALLKYGHFRLSFDFESARNSIQFYNQEIKSKLLNNLNLLDNQDILELLQEVYYKSVVKIKTKQYADFLVLIFSFQENLLRFLVKQKLLNSNSSRLNWKETKSKIRDKIQKGELHEYLKAYEYRGEKLRLSGELNRIVLIAILNYFSDLQNLVKIIEEIENYCDLRNDWVHDLKGVSSIENEGNILKIMRQILEFIKPNFEALNNPFNALNEDIVNQLTQK